MGLHIIDEYGLLRRDAGNMERLEVDIRIGLSAPDLPGGDRMVEPLEEIVGLDNVFPVHDVDVGQKRNTVAAPQARQNGNRVVLFGEDEVPERNKFLKSQFLEHEWL